MKAINLAYIFVAAFLLLFVSIPQAQITEDQPSYIFMSFRGGSIAKINLTNWQVKLLVKKYDREISGSDMKYFACCQKVVFETRTYIDGKVGVIDLQTDKLLYLDPVNAGLGRYIMNIVLSKSNENKFYMTTTDLTRREMEKPGTDVIGSLKFGVYDVVLGTLSKTEEPEKEESDFFPYRFDPNSIFRKNDNLLNTFKKKNVFSNNHKLKNAYYSDTQYSVVIYGEQVVVVKQSKSGDFTTIKSSPGDFVKQNPSLVEPYTSIVID